MITTEVLDVTQLEPRMKHPTIFRHFDELESGEGFVIHNDHDPKPLYYQLLGERGNIFQWEYLKQGPEVWEVRISKNGAAKGETVGEIAAKDIRKAEVFRKMGIDFCCGGGKTLSEAVENTGISEEDLRAALDAVPAEPVPASRNYDQWELGFLADYIVNTHHRYVKDNAPVVYQLAVKVAQHHGENHPELNKLVQGLKHFLEDLLHHLSKEEEIVFPGIRELLSQKANADQPTLENLKRKIFLMEKEHEVAGEDLSFFRKLTNNYTLPEDACNSYQYLFAKLQEFENDLHEHVHLENNILFPKALKLNVAAAN